MALRGPWGGDDLVKVAPIATDLTARRYEYHLDFPGDALNPGCDYLRWSRRVNAGHKPTVYAHVVSDPAYPGRLALQYWMFYVYNNWNNLHEGDWEMIQLNFDAASAAQALHGTPVEVGYSQHTGGERAGWGDDKLEIVGGTHPVVYPAAGSHAGFFDQALYLGASGSQGVGCDDTRNADLVVRPAVETIPSDGATALTEFPWIGFKGRWGELQPAFFNGPQGPNLKRSGPSRSSGRRSGGTGATRCPPGVPWEPERPTSSAARSRAGRSSCGTWSTTRSRPSPGSWPRSRSWSSCSRARPGARRRRSAWRAGGRRGQVITSAGRMYVNRWRLFLGIGVLFLPISLLITVLQAGVLGASSIAGIEDEGQAAGAFALIVVAIGTALTVLGITLVQAATAHALLEIDEGREVGPLGAYRMAAVAHDGAAGRDRDRCRRRHAARELHPPLARRNLAGGALGADRAGGGARGARDGLGARAQLRLVRGKWLKVASLTIASGAVVVIAGPLIGTGLILATDLPLSLLNVVAGVVYMVTMPFVALTTAYAYFDARVADELRPATAPGHSPPEIELSTG